VRHDDILSHSFFLNYESEQDVTSIRPGSRVRDPTVNDLRQLRYTPDGVISYKLSHTHQEFRELPINKKLTAPTDPHIRRLYPKPLPVSYKKYQHLQELKQTIPQFFHPYYDDLPHLSPLLRKNRRRKDKDKMVISLLVKMMTIMKMTTGKPVLQLRREKQAKLK
jgi:hypothetical protein